MKLSVDIEWRTTLFTALMLPLLVFLGFWQLHRAEQKTLLADTYEARRQMPPAPFDPELARRPADELRYLPVRLDGSYLSGRDILLENRIQQGQFGYEVVSPFRRAGDNSIVLVNRGWLAGDRSRQLLPEIPPAPANVEITGTVYVAPGEPYLLAEQEHVERWPLRLQALEMDKLKILLEPAFDANLFPHVLRIDANQPGALQATWQVINQSPQKHLAYAVQWFAMASALVALFIFSSTNLWQLIRGKATQ